MSGFHPFRGRLSRHFGDSLAPDDAYLSYHDVRLTKFDIDCIKNDWLTDNAIAFWEEYLEHEYMKAFPHVEIVLLRPSMSFMLMRTPNPLTLKEALPNFSHTSHIFLPINNAKNVEVPETGSHWSLLVASLVDGVAFHYDSLHSDNEIEGRIAAEKLGLLVGKRLSFKHLRNTPQQSNGSDCGVYVCLFMQYLLLDRLLKYEGQKVGMDLSGKNFDARDGRKEMIKIIESFRREGERRRSRSASPLRPERPNTPPRIG